MNKKNILIGWLVATIIIGVFVFRPIKRIKPINAPAAPAVKATVSEISENSLWVPDKIVFLNRLIFIEGEIKKRLIDELEVEVKRYRSTGLEAIKNNFWIAYIQKQIQKAEIPEDLIYLPIIESSMSSQAVSEKGASGFWQFMPKTAEEYGLKITPYVDERFDPIKSTDAALKHLNNLVDRFNDWTAALAGWNMDPAALLEAMKQEKTINFYNLKTIPQETQRFPFRLMATKLIFENPEKYGIPKAQWGWDDYRNYKIVEIEIIVQAETTIEKVVKQVQEEFPIGLKEFKKFNPHLPNSYLPRGNYNVYIVNNHGIP